MTLFNPAAGDPGDPLMPIGQRFPVNVGTRPLSNENPSVVTRLGVTALNVPDKQYVWLDDPDSDHSWPLS